MSLVELRREQQRDSIPDEQLGEGQHSAHKTPYYRESLSKSSSNSSLASSSSSRSPRLSVVRPSDPNSDTDSDTDNTTDEANDDCDDMLPEHTSGTAVAMALAPALPAKSTLRASRLLASLPQKLTPEEHPMLPHAAPHDVYLSEEDASSSADDFSDFESEPETNDCVKSHQRRSSHEDTARMVSVVFAGKPSIVELPPRSVSPGSSFPHGQTAGLLRTTTEPALNRPRSTSTSSSNFSHPPRSSSMLPNGFDKRRPSFLSIDPFAAKADIEEDSAKTPKTPTAMFKRTLSLVRKRSKPFLNQAANYSRDSFSSMQSPSIEQQEEAPTQAPSPPPEAQATAKAPANYQDIMRAARKNAQAASANPSPVDTLSPLSPNSTKQRIRSGLSMGRRRSVRT